MAENRVIHWFSGSTPCFKALFALEEKGLEYESKLLDFSKKEHKSEEILAINPRGQLPAFKDGDAVVNESAAILLYLESQYPEKPLVPSDAATKARVYQRFCEVLVADRIIGLYVLPKMRGLDDPEEEQHIADVKAEFALWEGYAADYKYIAADTLTLADLMFGPSVVFSHRYGMTFDNYPNLKRYYETMKDHPSLVKSFPPHWKDSPPAFDFMKVF